jgi:glycosyltransferase involved in cell wall biosynthesis
MRLSVVIPTHNKRRLLARTLEALAQQRSPAPWEIVVVDDGSEDGTSELLAAAASAHGGRLHSVRPARNVGRAAARNLGVRAATGRWILFLDDDILAPPGLLAAHLAVLERHQGSGTIGLVRTDPELVDAPHFHYLDTRGIAKVKGDRVPGRYFVTQNAALPRAEFLAVGGFDERFAGYGFEDVELAFRLEDRLGLVFRPVREPVPLHLHHHSLAEYLAKRRQVGRGALRRLARTHPHRIPEMRLHWIFPAGGGVDWRTRLVGRAARAGVAGALARLLGRWPVGGGHVPRLAWIYRRLMDGLILCCYRDGLAESMDEDANTA